MKHGDDCPECGGELHLNADLYKTGDEWLVCEEIDCGYAKCLLMPVAITWLPAAEARAKYGVDA